MKAKERLKEYWEKDPMTVIAVASGAVIAATALLNAVSAAQGRRAYARQIDYKIRHGK